MFRCMSSTNCHSLLDVVLASSDRLKTKLQIAEANQWQDRLKANCRKLIQTNGKIDCVHEKADSIH